jgi:hypothetical protein
MSQETVKYLEWPQPGNWHGCPYGIGDSQQRRRHAELGEPIKAELLDRLHKEPGVTIIDPLPHTLKALVSASTEAWRRLCDRHHPVIPPPVTVSECTVQRVLAPGPARRWSVIASKP